MQSNGTRIAALLAALAVIVVLFFAFRGGGDDGGSTTATPEVTTTATGANERLSEPAPAPADTIPVIEIAGGEPKGGVTTLEVDKGAEVRFAVRSNVVDEVHVHGYDIEQEIGPGKRTLFDFPADLDGVFRV